MTIFVFFVVSRKIFRNMRIGKFDINGYHVIVLTNPIEDSYESINRIFSMCWKNYVTNVVILIPAQNYDKILLYTFFPYSEKHCEEVKPVLQNYFENDSFKHSLSHFPQKCMNFHQCPLRVFVKHRVPYMITDEVNGILHVDGIEAVLLEELSRRLNFNSIAFEDENQTMEEIVIVLFDLFLHLYEMLFGYYGLIKLKIFEFSRIILIENFI